MFVEQGVARAKKRWALPGRTAPLGAGRPRATSQSHKHTECVAGALAALWPLSEGTLLAQLLAAARSDDALGRLAALLHLALEALPELSQAAGLPQAAGAEVCLDGVTFLTSVVTGMCMLCYA